MKFTVKIYIHINISLRGGGAEVLVGLQELIVIFTNVVKAGGGAVAQNGRI